MVCEGTLMTTVTAKHVKSDSHTRWETLWIPPHREHDELSNRAYKCLRERKIDMEQMVIFICFRDYRIHIRERVDPAREEGIDMDRGLVAGMDELCTITCNDLQIPAERVIKAASLFVELGLFQGLTLERPR